MNFKIPLALVLLFVLGCHTEEKTASGLLDYVPENSPVILKINDFDGLKGKVGSNDFLKAVQGWGLYESMNDKIGTLDHLRPQSESLVALTELGQDTFDLTFISDDFPELIDLETVQNKSVENFTYKSHALDKYTVEGNTFYSAAINGKRVISSSQALIENLLQNGPKATLDASLKRLYGMADRSKSASILVDLSKSKVLGPFLFHEGSKLKASDLSDWFFADLDADQDHVKLNGLAMARDSVKNYIDLFRNTHPLINVTPSFAPIDADAIVSYTFDDYTVFAKNREKYVGQTMPADSLFSTVEEIGSIYVDGQRAVLLNTYGSEDLAAYLEGIKKSDFMHQGNLIMELGSTDFLNDSFSPLVDGFAPNYGTILENAFLFSETKNVLQDLVTRYKSGSTFDKKPVYVSAREALASASTFLFVSDHKGLENVLKNDLAETILKDFKASDLDQLAFGTQLVADEDFFHTNTIVQRMEKEAHTVSVSQVFTVALDNELATDPQFVINHNTKKKEIVVQDVANVLYLISSTGEILWKKQLNGSVQGPIRQVDLLRNGWLQMAFTTENQFLVLDRNGEEVRPFTFSYEGGNLNPLAVFDYEGKRDYRFVVAQGEKIYMYDNKGSIVTGFKYTRAENPVLGVPKHFVVGKKDYLAFRLEDGTLKILNRVGDVRIKVDKKIDFSENEVYVYKDKFSVTDKKGTLYQIDGNGKISETRLNLNKDHRFDATNNTLVYSNDNVLDIRGKKIELDLGVYAPPHIFYLSDKIYVSITDLQGQNTYLFDSQAQSIPNFPVLGSSAIDLGDMDNDRKLELVVKEQGHSVVVYRIN